MAWWKRACCGVAALMTSLGAADDDPTRPNSAEYRAAYEVGRREAEAHLKQGRPTLYTFGLRMSGDDLDRETGLLYEPIAGCVVSDGIFGRANGNNDRIRAELAAKGDLPGSFKAHLNTLTHLADFVAKAEASADPAAKPVTLTLDGAAATSPDNRYSLRLGRAGGPDGMPYRNLLRVELREGGVLVEQADLYYPGGHGTSVRLVWGPVGSNFAVLTNPAAGGGQTEVSFHAIDLRRGRLIRVERAGGGVDAGEVLP